MKFCLLKSQRELHAWLNKEKVDIIFIPTMGALHRGHAELIHHAKKFDFKKNSKILISIFVNPLQFGAQEDFAKYPRDNQSDCELARNAGADAVWAPSFQDIFPEGHNSVKKIKAASHLQKHLCGKSRKGHFDGVTTVIQRLLEIVQPQLLILGEKDWQQFLIIRQLIEDLKIPTRLKGIATIREKDGLACSSRNRYLSKSERQRAVTLPQILSKASLAYKKGLEINLQEISSLLVQKGLKVEYLDLVDPFFLNPTNLGSGPCLLAAAVHCGETRLIDHTFLMSRKPIVAIDGPAGAGKSTVSKAFAERLGLLYLDTGAMYRAATWLIQQQNINSQDTDAISKLLKEFNLSFEQSASNSYEIFLNGSNITQAIRSPEVTSLVSKIASLQCVREALTKQQKMIGNKGGIVAEGRDIGTTVFPNAEIKVYLTASPEERANRRANDLKERGFEVPELEELKKNIEERDRIDMSREISPLTKAKDATEIITDGMNIEEVIQALIDLFRFKIPEEIWPSPN